MPSYVSEKEFKEALVSQLCRLYDQGRSFHSVVGPGRSGAIAAVYASHFLGIPMLNPMMRDIPNKLRPLLVIDTAIQTGNTLRSLQNRMKAEYTIALFKEPPRLVFWYETGYKENGEVGERLNPNLC